MTAFNDTLDDPLGQVFDETFEAIEELTDPRSPLSHLPAARRSAAGLEPGTVYGSSPVKRRTKEMLARLDADVIAAVELDNPATVRGIYYRVVSAGGCRKTEQDYKTIAKRLLHLRRNGYVEYRAITDGTRYVLHPRRFGSVQEVLEQTARTYRRRLWDHSDAVVQVFSEKDTLTGILAPICGEWDVPLGIARGYGSETFTHGVANGLDPHRLNVLYQFGDHDPSGVNAWESFVSKIRAFAPDVEIEPKRLAVTPEQIEEMNLPLRPTKKSDSRSRGWEGGSVEVDAIPATALRKILNEAISSHVDPYQLEVIRQAEDSERNVLKRMAVK